MIPIIINSVTKAFLLSMVSGECMNPGGGTVDGQIGNGSDSRLLYQRRYDIRVSKEVFKLTFLRSKFNCVLPAKLKHKALGYF